MVPVGSQIIPGGQQLTPQITWPGGQHVEVDGMQFQPVGQHVVPQSAVGQHPCEKQKVPVGQQIGPPATPRTLQTWLVGQQLPLMQV
jgi:hypothetical protein